MQKSRHFFAFWNPNLNLLQKLQNPFKSRLLWYALRRALWYYNFLNSCRRLRWVQCSWKVTSVAKLKNKYIVRSRISEKKFREILWYFSSDIEAVKIVEFTNISEKTINKITKNIRIFMSKECEVLKSNECSEVKDK